MSDLQRPLKTRPSFRRWRAKTTRRRWRRSPRKHRPATSRGPRSVPSPSADCTVAPKPARTIHDHHAGTRTTTRRDREAVGEHVKDQLDPTELVEPAGAAASPVKASRSSAHHLQELRHRTQLAVLGGIPLRHESGVVGAQLDLLDPALIAVLGHAPALEGVLAACLGVCGFT